MFLGATPSKRGRPKKTAANLSERYPALADNCEINAEEEQSAYDALCAEMKASKPQRDKFLPLMKSTFVMRRHYILHSAVSVKHILDDYPALKEPVVVCYIVLYLHFPFSNFFVD